MVCQLPRYTGNFYIIYTIILQHLQGHFLARHITLELSL